MRGTPEIRVFERVDYRENPYLLGMRPYACIMKACAREDQWMLHIRVVQEIKHCK